MMTKKFTLKTIITNFLMVSLIAVNAQDEGTGTGWEIEFDEPLVLSEDFTGFDFYHNADNTAGSNSKISKDDNGDTIAANISGTKTITFDDSNVTLTYTYDSCAFAPTWGVAGSLEDGIAVDPDPTTEGVSNGFVEIARQGYGTLAGEFIIDLTNLDYVEGIKYSHSSCGGRRRGFMLTLSTDNGTTWDTLRYQPGTDDYTICFTKDPNDDWSKEYNEIYCDPSAYGMLWEDVVCLENVMLKFSACNTVSPQAVRIHDFKVYGTLPEEQGVNEPSNGLKITAADNIISISEESDVSVYSLTGKLVRSVKAVNALSISDLNTGIYIVKAQAASQVNTQKVFKE